MRPSGFRILNEMKIGIALSGGGARGVAHLGILKALEEMSIRPAIISGTSAGSIIGALYAYGYSPSEIFDVVSKMKLYKILRPSFNWKGLLTLERTYTFFKSLLPADSFESLKFPLYVCATNLRNGRPAYFSSGELIRPVIASSAIPVIFSPVRIEDEFYIDGGVVNNLPVEPLAGRCDKIIGLHCNPVDENFSRENMKNLLERTFILAIGRNVAQRMDLCDIFLEPYELRKFAALEFSRISDIFETGYQYTIQEAGRIEKILKQKIV
jgi:NTE family protein